MRDRAQPILRNAVAVANAMAILMLGWWGVAADEWYLRASGGQASLHEFATWALIALNAPAFLLSIVTVSALHLGLKSEFIVQHAIWAAATLAAWWMLWRLERPKGRPAQLALQIFAGLAAVAAAWTTRLALLQAHDPHHSCWQALELPIMLAALAVLGSIVGFRRADSAAPASSF